MLKDRDHCWSHLQLTKPRHRDIKVHAQGHTARKPQSRSSKPSRLALEPALVTKANSLGWIPQGTDSISLWLWLPGLFLGELKLPSPWHARVHSKGTLQKQGGGMSQINSCPDLSQCGPNSPCNRGTVNKEAGSWPLTYFLTQSIKECGLGARRRA